MKRSNRFALWGWVLFLVVALTGCGISKEEHEKKVGELKGARLELDQALGKIGALEKKLDQAKNTIAGLENSLAKAVQDLEAERSAPREDPVLKGKLEAAGNLVENLTSKIKGLTGENSQLQGFTKKLTSQVKGLTDENSLLQGMTQKLTSQVSGLTHENKQLQAFVKQLESKLGGFQKKLQDMQLLPRETDKMDIKKALPGDLGKDLFQ